MPAWRLDGRDSSLQCYGVGGQDSATVPDFVRHVGLADVDCDDVCVNSEVSLTHMGPPLETGSAGHPIQTAGHVPLTADEQAKVRFFITELSSEYEAEQALAAPQQYFILPHFKPPDAACTRRRYSCAGFIVEAYRDANIRLIAVNDEALPRVGLATLVQAYPDWTRELNNGKLRARLGLTTPEPWPVILPGYVLNSLNRPREQIVANPYVPKAGDEYFPPQNQPAVAAGLQPEQI